MTGHDLVGLDEMPAGAVDQRRADLRQVRMLCHLMRIGRGDAAFLQLLARQIEPAEPGVLVDVAQDVGQLQRPPEMMGEQDTVVGRQPEHTHRQPSDRTRHPVTIEIQRRHVGRADLLGHVHFHAIDDGEEILAL